MPYDPLAQPPFINTAQTRIAPEERRGGKRIVLRICDGILIRMSVMLRVFLGYKTPALWFDRCAASTQNPHLTMYSINPGRPTKVPKTQRLGNTTLGCANPIPLIVVLLKWTGESLQFIIARYWSDDAPLGSLKRAIGTPAIYLRLVVLFHHHIQNTGQ